SRRTINVEKTAANAMVAIDGAGFDWSYMADDEVPTNMALIAFLNSEGVKYLITVKKCVEFVSYNDVPPPPIWLFSPPKLDLSNSGLEEFQQPEFEGYRPMTSKSVSKDISNEEFDGEYVTFGGGAKGWKITGKGTLKTGTKDETSGILKSFITEIENLVDKKVKIIRYRVLVVKPHNKTLYELFRGRTPALRFMRPFGCHATILNTLDHLRKFDGKSDDGFFIGYSLYSKAFRVYNIRTRKVEENLHIRFLENKLIIVGDGPKWLFDLDALTKLMNYVPVVADGSLFDSSSKNASYDEPQPFSDAGNKDDEGSSVHTRKITKTTSEQGFLSVVYEGKTHKTFILICLLVSYLKKNQRRGPLEQNRSAETRKMKEVLWIKAIRLFLAYASFKDFVVYQIDVKSAFLYGMIEEEVYVYQLSGFEDLEFPDRVYKIEKVLYGLHQAPRAWYETLSTYLLDNIFHKGQIDKTLFIKMVKGDILLVQVYVDVIIFGSTKKEMCTEFEKMIHKKFQMSSMRELTYFLGLQVTQKDDGIFINQDKYVDEILKKFGFSTVKTASTPMETLKSLLKDENAKDVDVHLYRSMIGSLMYLTSSRPNIMFVVYACARFQVTLKVSHLHAVKESLDT
nr:retrovirus-related Pol polyprotein from transposon TNT 1-94 [Tanacetum cinerariifolium]